MARPLRLELAGGLYHVTSRADGRDDIYVFQGRYRAIRVERDSCLLELALYIVRNPLRAGMIEQLDAWPWSRYLATCAQAPAFEVRYARNETMARAYLAGQHTMAAIAEHFSVHYSTVSRG